MSTPSPVTRHLSPVPRHDELFSFRSVGAKFSWPPCNLGSYRSVGAKLLHGKSLNIITGTGMTYRRPDGINVISLVSLGK